jgi:hypothetical protein
VATLTARDVQGRVAVVDTSVLVAILLHEPDAALLAKRLLASLPGFQGDG